MTLIRKVKKIKEKYIDVLLYKNKQKYFCIGLNKTGTTSLRKAFIDVGFKVGNQRSAELLLDNIKEQDYKKLIRYCNSAEVFQDVPFSFFGVYKVLHEHFPEAKFILTVRDSPDQWVNSITKFHAKKFSQYEAATAQELKDAKYVWEGWMWQTMLYNFEVSEIDPYNKDNLVSKYNEYNNEVRSFFKNSSNFIELNLAEKDSYSRFTDFIDVNSPYEDFPWENKTATTKTK